MGPCDACFIGDLTGDMNEVEKFVFSNSLQLVEAAAFYTHCLENTVLLRISFLITAPI